MQVNITSIVLTYWYAVGGVLGRQREELNVTVQLLDLLKNYNVKARISRLVRSSLFMRQSCAFSSHGSGGEDSGPNVETLLPNLWPWYIQ